MYAVDTPYSVHKRKDKTTDIWSVNHLDQNSEVLK